MNQKILILSILTILTLLLCIPFTFATDVVMDLNTTAENNANITATDTTATEDNTIYTSNPTVDPEEPTTDTSTTEELPVTSAVTSDYEDSSELSVASIINIILIVVGVVLILLGIAIILRLK